VNIPEAWKSAPAGDSQEVWDDQARPGESLSAPAVRKFHFAGVDDRLPATELQRPYHQPSKTPIEFIPASELPSFTQREVGIDTDCLRVALKNTLRQAPGRDS